MFNVKLEPESLKKEDFIRKTNKENIRITHVGKVFENRKFKKNQVIILFEHESLNIQCKYYLTLSDSREAKITTKSAPPKRTTFKLFFFIFTSHNNYIYFTIFFQGKRTNFLSSFLSL